MGNLIDTNFWTLDTVGVIQRTNLRILEMYWCSINGDVIVNGNDLVIREAPPDVAPGEGAIIWEEEAQTATLPRGYRRNIGGIGALAHGFELAVATKGIVHVVLAG